MYSGVQWSLLKWSKDCRDQILRRHKQNGPNGLLFLFFYVILFLLGIQ